MTEKSCRGREKSNIEEHGAFSRHGWVELSGPQSCRRPQHRKRIQIQAPITITVGLASDKTLPPSEQRLLLQVG